MSADRTIKTQLPAGSGSVHPSTPTTSRAAHPPDAATSVERDGNDFVLDAALVGGLLGIDPADVATLMRTRHITSVCETGIGADRGTYRLNLFCGSRHARLRINAEGRIISRSVIDFGEQPLPRRRRSSSRPAPSGG